MSKAMRTVSLVVLCVLILAVPSVWANWVQDGVALCTAAQDQWYPQIISDGAGGGIVTWYDGRSSGYDIYAQRMNSAGSLQWTTDGVALCTATGDQVSPMIVSDGAGGGIVTWYDGRSGGYDIYAQRMNDAGSLQWTTDGVALCAATENQVSPMIVSDGAGGAIVVWMDYRSGDNSDIYAQRVNASGAVQWTADGVALCTATGEQDQPAVVSDGAGGAIVTWRDFRSEGHYEVYAQSVNASGIIQWTVGGIPLCAVGGDQCNPAITSDGTGGAIVAWHHYRSGNWDIYAQRVNASGAVQWAAGGVALCRAAGMQIYPTIAPDGASGAVVTWFDARGGGYDIYAQRVNASGAVQWTTDGVPVCTAAGDQRFPKIISDGASGAIVTWYDNRSGGYDIYAQRMNDAGSLLWTTNGVALCMARGNQGSPTIASDGASGAIVTWWDERSGNDIYCQRVDANGFAPPKVPVPATPRGLTGKPIYYNNSIAALLITWNRNIESNISHYEVYRDSIEDFVPGPGNLLASPSDTFLYDVQWRWLPHRYYRVAAVDSNGYTSGFALLPPGDLTGTGGAGGPEATYLSQNYPNPFNPVTRIVFGLSAPGHVSLRIYDAAGRLVRMLAEGNRPAANCAEVWDGKDSSGRAVASGIYFCRLDAGSFTQTRKMVLLR